MLQFLYTKSNQPLIPILVFFLFGIQTGLAQTNEDSAEEDDSTAIACCSTERAVS